MLTFFLSASYTEAKLLERVVAVVNGEVITSIELEQASQAIITELRKNTPPADLEKELSKAREKTLDEMIEGLLIVQKAKELKISVSNEEITAAIERMAAENNLSVEQLYSELKKSNIPEEEYRRKLGNQILRSKLLNYEVSSRIVISEEKAHQYYDTVYLSQKIPEGYHIMQIGFTWETSGSASISKKDARKRAESIRKMALEGQNFSELARSFSELPSSKHGGDIGFFKEDEMAGYMRDMIINLKPGEISDIVDASTSFQFFLMLARNVAGKAEFPPFELVRSQIQNKLRQEELQNNYQKWMQELQTQALIKKLL